MIDHIVLVLVNVVTLLAVVAFGVAVALAAFGGGDFRDMVIMGGNLLFSIAVRSLAGRWLHA